MSSDEGGRRADVSGVGPAGWTARLAAPALVATIAGLIAAPWLDERLVWCEWAGAAAALLVVPRIRGWCGEAWALAGAVLALAIAFHWTPAVLAYAMNSTDTVGLLFAAPIVLWDAVRLALPLWVAGRVARDPASAWLPAGLTAAAAEATLPSVFPWKLGYAQAAWPVLVQSVDLFGAEFSTFILFAHAGVLVWLVATLAQRFGTGPPIVSRLGPVAVVVCLVNAGYGAAGMAIWSRVAESAPRLRMAVVQANPAEAGGLDELRRLTRRACAASGPKPDIVCWPECSGGSYEAGLESLADPARVVAASRPPNRGLRPLEEPICPLLFGGQSFVGHPEKPRAIHQSAILVDAAHTIVGRYHKRHLMPFGEYVPGSAIYPDLELHFPLADEMTEGTDATVLACGPAARLGVLLCYEDMIPEAARSLVAGSANVLVSLVNGSAFTAPLTLRQHRLLAQLRAVECRRALVRCAATGDTCVISPLGTIPARLPLHAPDVLVADVPLLAYRTLASRLGPAFPVAAALALAALIGRHVLARRTAVGPLADHGPG